MKKNKMKPAEGKPPARQLVLDLPFRPALGADDFLVTKANEAAVAAIDAWPDWPNPVLLLTGPPGSGKSHLSEVWRTRSQARMARPEDLGTGDLPALLQTGALVIEDLPGKTLNETALFHLINLSRELKASLLLTSQTPPSRWGLKLKDLISRLNAAGVAALGPPDDVLLRAVLVKQFYDRGIRVDAATISFMVTRMERSLASARELAGLIDREALAEKARVTRPFAARIMARQGGTS